MGDYLRAEDVSRAAYQFCTSLMRRNRAAAPALRLLQAEEPHIRDNVLAHHPVLTATGPLGAKLAALPRTLGLHGVRSCLRYDSPVLQPPLLLLDITARPPSRSCPRSCPGSATCAASASTYPPTMRSPRCL